MPTTTTVVKKRTSKRRYRKSKTAYGTIRYPVKTYGGGGKYAYYKPRYAITDILPKKVRKTLVYCSEMSLNPATTSYTYNVFSVNGLYDPDISGTGHQPYGFDTYMTLYKRYRVLNSKITATYCPSAAADLVPAYMSIIQSYTDASPGFTNASHFMEFCSTQKAPVVGIGSYNSALGGLFRRALIHSKWSCKKNLGDPKDDANWGDVSSNPSTQEYYSVVLYSVASNDPPAMNIMIRITYDVEFFEPLIISQS